MSSVVRVEGLCVALPDGTPVVENSQLVVRPGDVVALLGPSGVGKTTLLRAIFAPEELTERGFAVSWSTRKLRSEPAFVPQRGALLDHLDVAGNISLAQKGAGFEENVESWLAAVDLDGSLAKRKVSALSGGQAQRVAVARTLAARKKLIILDEPSVGLDPVGVRLLARLLTEQARRHEAGIILVTHDLALAGGAANWLLFLDPGQRQLVPVLPNWRGPVEADSPEVRVGRLAELEAALEALLRRARPHRAGKSGKRRTQLEPLAPIRVAGEALLHFFEPRLFGPSLGVFFRSLVQAMVRPMIFYAIVGMLLGITVPYVIVHISEALKPSAVLGLIGGSYILSLAPPLSAIVFVATSGSAVNAWLGGMRLNGQVLALEGLAVPPVRYLWSPAWVALVCSFFATVFIFAAAMTAGGWFLFQAYDVPYALDKLTADFMDPPASRLPYVVRAMWLVFSYAIAIASIVVSKGSEAKERSDDVTAAMTSAVMRATLFVVVMELVTVAVVQGMTGKNP
jgi:ABC-type nitrate/sulfonate/bicarbonate transport system ATPase subunit/ABC-type transporter Mla maintaining outer membrane lipid asymmetry permease subunit MlaE